jgi:hypothetical protein
MYHGGTRRQLGPQSEDIPDYDIKTSGGVPGSDSKVQMGLFLSHRFSWWQRLLTEFAVLSAFTVSWDVHQPVRKKEIRN